MKRVRWKVDGPRWYMVTKNPNGYPGGRVRQDGPTSFEARTWLPDCKTIVTRHRSLAAAKGCIVRGLMRHGELR